VTLNIIHCIKCKNVKLGVIQQYLDKPAFLQYPWSSGWIGDRAI